MPSTSDADDYYFYTLRPVEKHGPKRFSIRVEISRRDTNEVIERLDAEGASQSKAERRAKSEALSAIAMLGVPKDWSGK